MKSYFLVILTLIAVVLSSCSQSSPVTPGHLDSELQTKVNSQYSGNPRYLLGMYDIAYDPDSGTASVTPRRDISKHWNVLKFLDDSPCGNCVSIIEATPVGDGSIDFKIQITNPFPSANLTGFDLRGVALFDGSYYFPANGLSIPDKSQGDGYLSNAGNYTTLYNGSTAPYGPYGGYYKGDLATEITPNANLNGFIRYESVIPGGNERAIFNAGDSVVRTFNIFLPQYAMIFGYAVDLSWAPPTVKPVTDPKTDFPPEANSPEPYLLVVSQAGVGLTTTGGNLDVHLYVYDHVGKDSYNTPTIECPGLFPGVVNMTYVNLEDPEWYVLHLDGASIQASPGTYKGLVRVEAKANLTSPPHLDLSNYCVTTIEVIEDAGFVKTVGGSGFDAGFSIDVTDSGYIYQTGFFDVGQGSVDFDPSSEVDTHSSKGLTDVFLSKFDVYGNYYWTVTFGGAGLDAPLDLNVNEYATEIGVCGYFSGTMDLSEINGPVLTSNGGTDAFLLQIDYFGQLQWAKSWGGPGNDKAKCIDYGSSEIMIGGAFEGTVDFDTDPGSVHERTSNGKLDGFASAFSSDGIYLRSSTIGGPENEEINSVAQYNNAHYIAGYFEGTADLEPNEFFSDLYTSAGFQDGFIVKISDWWSAPDVNGTVRQITSPLSVVPSSILIDDSAILIVAGNFAGTADFNYGGSPMNRTSNGGLDAFSAIYTPELAYYTVSTWGGFGTDTANSVGFRSQDETVFVCGSFELDCDFDPGPGSSTGTSKGYADCYVSAIEYQSSINGSLLWSRQFGSAVGNDTAISIAGYKEGTVFTTGGFWGQTQFAPPGGDDNRTSIGQNDSFLIKYLNDGSW